MALQPYEGYLDVYWKGANFRNLIHAVIDKQNISQKRTAWRKKIIYITCNCDNCEHLINTKKCPAIIDKAGCMCPHSKGEVIEEPRKDTKMYKDFCELVNRIPYLNCYKQYSDFVWQNRNHECDQDDYELLKRLPRFGMNQISDAEHTLEEALTIVEKNHDYRIHTINYIKGPECTLINTLSKKYQEEVTAYKKLVTMETFLDKATIEYNNFKKRIGKLFIRGGDYVIIRIPHLTQFEQYGMQNIFVYPDSKSQYYNRKYNAVKLEDFTHIYAFLISLQPNTYDSVEYQKHYVPLIKEQFPKFCKEIGLNFMETAV